MKAVLISILVNIVIFATAALCPLALIVGSSIAGIAFIIHGIVKGV